MKITRLPSTRPINQPPKIVVVQEKKSGCLPFIIGVVLVLLAIILLYVILVIGGLLAGFVPAKRAMTIKAIEALREE